MHPRLKCDRTVHTVAYDPFLGSDHETNNETTFAARQQILISKNRRLLLGKHVPAATDTQSIIYELLETVFSTRSVQNSYKEDN
jgi:hypothetical protein